MGKNEEWDSDSDSREGGESSGSGEEEEEEEDEEKEIGSKSSDGISEYEKQRLSRIAQNNAKMEALGLARMASSFMGSAQKSGQQPKGKRKKTVDGGGDGDDEDYRPTDDANADEDDEEEEDKEEEEEDEDEDYLVDRSSSKSRKQKARNKGSRARKVSVRKKLSSADYVEEDDDLMQAIALSLQDSEKGERPLQRSDNAQTREDAGRKKGKKSEFTSRVQMTEDELILHFFQFDEAGKGTITVRDLERVAIAHDFTWTDKELADMISCFDGNGDGKLNLEDFHNIAGRCKMIQGSGNH